MVGLRNSLWRYENGCDSADYRGKPHPSMRQWLNIDTDQHASGTVEGRRPHR